jgi:hypothetical protein
MTGCYLADHGIHERGDMPSCDGFFVRCHLLPKQLLSRKGIPYSQIWSEDVWVWACGGPQGNAGHHGMFDTARTIRLPREAIPERTERFALANDLDWWLDREYGPRG